ELEASGCSARSTTRVRCDRTARPSCCRGRRQTKGAPQRPLVPCRFPGSGRERRAAAAGGRGVWVLDDELGALEIFLVVDLGTEQVLVAHGVDEQRDVTFLHGGVVLVHFLVERESVLEAGTTAALHEHAQLQLVVAFLLDQFPGLGGCAVG